MTSIEKSSLRTAILVSLALYGALAVMLTLLPARGALVATKPAPAQRPLLVEIGSAPEGDSMSGRAQPGIRLTPAPAERARTGAAPPKTATPSDGAPAVAAAAGARSRQVESGRGGGPEPSPVPPPRGIARRSALPVPPPAVTMAASVYGRNSLGRASGGQRASGEAKGGGVGAVSGATPIGAEVTTGSDAEASVAAVLATIRERVLSERVYPAAAERRGIQGRLTVEATIAADGRLAGVRLVRSSGSSILDKAGLNLLREVFPIENPLLHSFTVVIPITYQLENHG